MIPDVSVPVSVWEQIPVVVIFALLLAGLGWVLVKIFVKAIADINSHYAHVIKATNEQWQKYFDARSAANQLINDQVVKQLEGLTRAVEKLVDDFESHDQMERQVFGDLTARRKPSKRNPNL